MLKDPLLLRPLLIPELAGCGPIGEQHAAAVSIGSKQAHGQDLIDTGQPKIQRLGIPGLIEGVPHGSLGLQPSIPGGRKPSSGPSQGPTAAIDLVVGSVIQTHGSCFLLADDRRHRNTPSLTVHAAVVLKPVSWQS